MVDRTLQPYTDGFDAGKPQYGINFWCFPPRSIPLAHVVAPNAVVAYVPRRNRITSPPLTLDTQMPHDLAQETYTYILMSTEKGFFAVTMAIRYCCRPDQLRQPDRKIYKLGPWNHCFSPTGSHLPCDIQSTIVDSNHLRKRQHIKSGMHP